ncbi:unnamed protein product [Umbelopsis ramanniana]
MSICNRTQEFQAFASRLSSRTNPNNRRAQINIVQYVPKRGNASTFTLTAKELGRHMKTTEVELEKLKSLTNRRALFDEKPVEISELTYIIKQNITKLNHGISILQSTTKAGPKQPHQVREHYSEVVSSLQNRLANISVEFKEVLEKRTENIKLSKERRDQFFQSSDNRTPSPAPLAPAPAAPSPSPSGGNTYTPPEVSELHRRKTYAPTVPPQEEDTTLSLGIPLLTPQQQQLQADSRYTEQRSNALESIENTIQELGGMFQQLVTMVAEQRETVQR